MQQKVSKYITKQTKSRYCRRCQRLKIKGENYCKIHTNKIQQLRKEKSTAQKRKKKKELRTARTTMLQRKQQGEFFLWELTQKRFKELKHSAT